ncbi:MAG TPA: TonB family protein [Candidatus Sulfotelmatobacter sp.]|nr:TonB family protein [Candidatus Sulfotelmatobacter sp.]
MGYRALLFCPDEKIARTVTQVLSELEFAVEPCAEPFVAVKKLMAEHFDAVVVDCDNDQNASLLFKSARNSATNQASLAVAVVEGQAGVAKAFRIGANLVLTKPINVEQAKGTLRVARGLLRKSEAAKPAAPAGTPTPAPSVPPKAAAPARPATLSAANAAKSRPVAPAPISNPAAGAAATPQSQTALSAAAHSINAASGSAITGNEAAQPSAKSALPFDPSVASPEIKVTLPVSSGSAAFGSGAASAPAPAREAELAVKDAAPIDKISAATATPADSKTADSKADASAEPAPAPSSFTFGGANLPEKSASLANKKTLIAVAAVVIVAAASYFGWSQFHEKTSTPATAPKPATSAPVATPPATQRAQAQLSAPAAVSSPSTSTASPQSTTADSQPSSGDASDDSTPDKDDAAVPAANSKPNISAAPPATSSATKTAPASKPAAQPAAPIVLKNGSTKSSTKPAANDAPAPSMVGIAADGSDGSLSNLTSPNTAAKPILQTLTISQGVSQGLLLKKVQPVYPPTALRMHTEGAVKLLATVGKTGSITAVKVLNGEPLLSQSAIEAVKQWKYKPYLLNGDAVEIQTEVTINFKLPN